MNEVSAEDREKAIKAIGRRMTWPSLHWRDLGHTDAHAAIVDLLIDEGWSPGGATARPSREALEDVVQRAIWETHRGPLSVEDWAMIKGRGGPTLGQAVVEARRIVAALLAAGHLWAEQSTAGVPVDQVLVVDREALAAEVRVVVDRFYQQTVAEITQSAPLHDFVVDALIGSGLFVDRATVEAETEKRIYRTVNLSEVVTERIRAEQREKDAQIAESLLMSPGSQGIAAVIDAIRAGGTQ